MHLAAAVDTLAQLQHGVNTPQDGLEVTHRVVLDRNVSEYDLCPTGWT